MGNVLVVIEQRENVIQTVSLELLGKATEIAKDYDTKVSALLLGSKVEDLIDTLAHYGADEVIVVDDEALAVYTTEPYTKAAYEAIKAADPIVVLFGATSIGRDLAPRVSARVHTGLTADCTGLAVAEDTKLLLMTRPAFGGNIMATIVCKDFRPQMSTVRPGVMKKNEVDETREAVINRFKVEFTEADKLVQVVEIIKEAKKQVKIEDAKILVSAGRGMGGKENLDILYELAEVIGGEVSGSRATIDAGWLDKARQVGQTGKTVRPDLYIACGISGAIQHIAGMEDAEFIVAINKNPEAPIFKYADVGIVGDVHKVLPELISQLSVAKEKGEVLAN
ncbi:MULTISPECIES: electron transfer flavoprotein subunit alpha/FixB family protein [unclassified Clostridioides]|uniref:electron transfer flavoprotein subunit alpha/FixB family protein n=1 Tax=unclassified Clostridioides TaxID=2635829 RepID=UPI001D0CB9EB|nr:electron transfer flavoprotein subunit alpha/FixB family protein [Clostridioides sp. ES-S-0001-02]MCC0651577.1 electron transfer flavoprotein subunit alpha/FixB family protein [Clostridioides sp. ES-S-0001-03]MCC0657383.1 electron transfer flavoprotein subunit alpha/FixB family protein [Clostridioides sp. ES-S-0123-01]MCC0672788.1 electron transfer flavoprotein subunit alpha/FixB family protein [Clostridioides sp. ES-S-0145-01]MCC0678661.1 electron transfer flavoprotein subunit alpha/FixB fa